MFCYLLRWLGEGPNITVVDTPGFKDTDDAEFVDELLNVLGDEVGDVLCTYEHLQSYKKCMLLL